jgi:hypothetical protein
VTRSGRIEVAPRDSEARARGMDKLNLTRVDAETKKSALAGALTGASGVRHGRNRAAHIFPDVSIVNVGAKAGIVNDFNRRRG